MNKTLVGFAAVLALLVFTPGARADLLKDNTMQEGTTFWKGDGEVAYLNPDGTEGQQGDKGVTATIKIPLAKSHPRYIYQNYDAPADLAHLVVSVEVFASFDFKRSKRADDYSSDQHWTPGSVWYWSAETVPNVDFWMRGSGFQYKMSNLKPGQWQTIKVSWDAGPSQTERILNFFVPAGEGAVYIRKATADSK